MFIFSELFWLLQKNLYGTLQGITFWMFPLTLAVFGCSVQCLAVCWIEVTRQVAKVGAAFVVSNPCWQLHDPPFAKASNHSRVTQQDQGTAWAKCLQKAREECVWRTPSIHVRICQDKKGNAAHFGLRSESWKDTRARNPLRQTNWAWPCP